MYLNVNFSFLSNINFVSFIIFIQICFQLV